MHFVMLYAILQQYSFIFVKSLKCAKELSKLLCKQDSIVINDASLICSELLETDVYLMSNKYSDINS